MKYPLSFLRSLEAKYNINLEAEFASFVLIYPNDKMNLNEGMENDIRSACQLLGISISEIVGPSRRREIALLRQLLMSVFYLKYPVTLKTIGNQFGGRDHSTVLHSIETIENLREIKDPLLMFYENTLISIISEQVYEPE